MATATIFRINKLTDTFTRISNKIFKDRRLSNKTLGLLCKILSLPEDWDYSIHGLVSICKEGERSVKDSLNELKEYGYLTVEKTHNDKGHYRYIYTVYEEPIGISSRGTKPHCGNHHVVTQHNKLNNINDLNNISQQKIGNSFDHIEENFKEFWKLYPKRIAKTKAKVSFARALKTTSSDVILQGVKNYLKKIEIEKTENKFIAHPTTWLNQCRWEDEYDFEQEQKNDSSSPSRLAKPQDNYVHYEQVSDYDYVDNIFKEKGITEKEFYDKIEQWKISVYNETGEFVTGEVPNDIIMKILNKEI